MAASPKDPRSRPKLQVAQHHLVEESGQTRIAQPDLAALDVEFETERRLQQGERRGPTLYPVACAPQAWASLRRSRCWRRRSGSNSTSQRGEIRLRDPRLPAFLNEVVLRDLQLGPSSVDLRIRRHGDEVSLEVMRTRGHIQVSIVLTH